VWHVTRMGEMRNA